MIVPDTQSGKEEMSSKLVDDKSGKSVSLFMYK